MKKPRPRQVKRLVHKSYNKLVSRDHGTKSLVPIVLEQGTPHNSMEGPRG